ncbi:unnamed protein product [Cylicocyclus nassatus]|uniref:Uncharacterized protein n=1 Tax=Cylicocyclus nassatus TaxID=53992 RepID=A0AA36GGF6_CYLNA|nr:unnamed protein product [Cylicocyclus nassatus]
MIPSKLIPTSVDKVRPGDIKAVAAMGDEFLLSPLSGTFKEQGSSFVTGGEGFLRNHATLLNILRFYNANVTAGSYGCNPLNECFNVAQLNATSNDLEQQAISLIKKMKSAGAVYEIQDERNFDAKDFTVVVQGFLEGAENAVIDESGNYDSAFYTKDLKQLTKYGYELIAKAYWTSLLEPVGKKNLAPSITDKRNRLKCPIKKKNLLKWAKMIPLAFPLYSDYWKQREYETNYFELSNYTRTTVWISI